MLTEFWTPDFRTHLSKKLGNTDETLSTLLLLLLFVSDSDRVLNT